jgi:hypothetical protein
MFFGFKRSKAVSANAVIASGAKQSISRQAAQWIASSLALPCTNASRLSQAMTLMQYHCNPVEFNNA